MEKVVTEKKQIKKMPEVKKQSIEKLSQEEVLRIEGLIDAIQATGLDEFMEYIRSPRKMFWPNLFAGMVRGIGALFGVTVVLAAIGWIFAITIDLPLIGERLEPYVKMARTEMNKYIDQTNYSDEFQDLSTILRQIEQNTKPTPTPIPTAPAKPTP